MSGLNGCSKAFHRDVRRAIEALVAEGCRLRVKDGSHVILLPPEGVEGPTKKVSAKRPHTETIHFLHTQFAAKIPGLERVIRP
jgi:hypothetical protein